MTSKLRLAALMLMTAAVPALCGGILTQEEERHLHIPAWVVLHELDETRTIGGEEVRIRLHGGRLELTGTDLAYTADETWLTADILVFDIDRDGAEEVLLHVWKPGSFGKYQPFWREADNKTLYSEHLFLYEWDTARPDRLDPIWMSSAMPVYGREVTADERGVICVHSPDGSESRWYWGSWGLLREDETDANKEDPA